MSKDKPILSQVPHFTPPGYESFHKCSQAGSRFCSLKTIYSSLIQPVFDYCYAVWGNLNKRLPSKTHKLQNRAACIITSQGSADFLIGITLLNSRTVATRRDKRLCLLMYDTINNEAEGLEAMGVRGKIVLVKSNQLVKNIENKIFYLV